MSTLFSQEDLRLTYEEVEWHRRSREIIQRFALNQKDIRDAALEGLDMKDVHKVLDLGCGYGFFIERLSGKVSPDAHITGIDVIDKNNREPFENTIRNMGYTGTFIQGNADLIRDMEDSSFDLVIASYSLYFFPHLIPEVARILRRNGLFIAVTHSVHSLQELMRFVPVCMEQAGMKPPDDLMMHKLFQSFSLENGGSQLSLNFEKVERIPYRNSLLFPLDHFNDFAEYIRNKKHLLFKEASETCPPKVDEVSDICTRTLHEQARIHGKILINKDDGIFRSYLPVHEKAVI
jgi:SAM-dependent methyltransferase